jgi:hypothetical protein
MLGYTREEVEKMSQVLNYSLAHHLPNTTGESARFIEEDSKVLRKLEDFINGLLHEERI